MAERGEAVEEQAVRDGSAVYSVEAKIANSEDVPPGYKRTEVGVIPQDWIVRPLGDIADLKNGYAFKSVTYRNDAIYKIITISNVQDGYISLDNCSAINSLPSDLQQHQMLAPGDILISMTGNVGRVCVVDRDRCLLNQRVGKIIPRSTDKKFVFFVLHDRRFRHEMIESAVGGAQGNIGKCDILSYPCLLPGMKDEQRAIATALSDADALIESLDRLIAKKRAIKQAAMQQLLTGQTRLLGFTGEWETKRLGEVACFYKGNGLSKADLRVDGANPCVHYGELFTQYGEKIIDVESRTDPKDSCFISFKNDVLMPTSDVTPNGLATASCIIEPGVMLGGDILVIRPNGGQIDGVFLAYKIRIDHRQIMQLVSGTTVFHIYARDMANFVYEAPPVDEQRAIVSVLSDMETEIEALERRRDKAREIKQGMMQRLLTGRVRLV